MLFCSNIKVLKGEKMKEFSDVSRAATCASGVIPESFCRESVVTKRRDSVTLRAAKPYGMTYVWGGRTANDYMASAGFTLIELLVVVLIIGILSAVALPQYTKAVEKSRATEAELWLSNAKKAFDLFYLENGGYPSSAVYFNPNMSNSVESAIDLNSGTWMTGTSESYSKNFTTNASCNSSSCNIEIYRNKTNPDIAGDIYRVSAIYYPSTGRWGQRGFTCNDVSAKAVAQNFKLQGFSLSSGC